MRQRDDSSIVRGALLLTAVNLFSQILGFAYRVWLSRLIDPEALGLYQLIMPVYSVVMSLCVSGITVAVSRMTASYTALGNERAVRQVVRNALMGYILLTLGLCLLIVPFSDAVSVYLLGDARTRLGLLFLLPCIMLTGWENVHKNYFYGRKNVVPPAISEVLEQLSRAAAILGLLIFLKPVYHEQQVGLIVIGMIISEVISASLLTFMFRITRREVVPTGVPLPDMRRRMAQIAVPVALANVSVNLIGSVNTIIIPARLIASGVDSSQALSSYGVAFGMTMPLLALPMAFVVAVSLVTIPRVSESVALRDYKSLLRKIKSSLLIITAITLPMTALLILFGKPISVALFKNPNAGAYMEPLAVATLFSCFEYVLHSLLNGIGKQKAAAANMIAAGVLQLALTWLGVARPELRLMGYVWAYLAANVLGCFLNLRDLVAYFRKDINKLDTSLRERTF